MMSLGSYVRRLRAWFVHLLHLDDSTHRIALGAAVGMFVALTPTIGFQMLIVLLLLTFIPGNRVAGLPMVWVTNPATAVPVYVFNYRVGAWLLGHRVAGEVYQEWADLVHRVPSFWQVFHSPVIWMGDLWSWLGRFWKAMEGIMAPLWLGSVVVGLAGALATYAVMYCLIRFYRDRLRGRLERLAHLRGLRARRHAARRKRKNAAHVAQDAAPAAAETADRPPPPAAAAATPSKPDP
jgi:uncharacterized protein (DUF2062 family)